MNKEYICDICGHYWYPHPSEPDTCGICAMGGMIEMGGDLDWRKEEREKLRKKEREENERT